MRAALSTSAAMRHPRVEETVEEVGDEVHDDHDERDEEERALGERVVARRDRLDEEAAETGPAEDGLDDDVGADVRPDREAEGGQHRKERVPRRVVDDDAPFRKS